MDQTEYDKFLKSSGEYGVVLQVAHPIVFIEGLPTVKTHEVILFETGQKGEVFAINRGKIEARVFSHEPIKVGVKATRTNQLLSIPVGTELLGHAVNPLGDPLDPSIPYTKPTLMRDMEAKPVGIAGRQKITTPMATGISLVDLLIPLGRGQRELVIGDRKTGKTSLLMTAIKKQVEEGVIAIYAAIAKRKSDIKRLQQFFIQEKINDKIIIIATSSYDSPSLIYQTPYAAMSVAEHFRDQGQNTLVIMDDLSTHAKFYRELSLLARRFPGRDSYPGDIFYVHSRLLERGGNFKHKTKGEVAISCLPVIEIVEGDFTGYIATNVMGITDGHIYLDSGIYYEGRRPAVNIPLSVTRVGRQTLDKLSREINKDLMTFLATYDKLLNLSHFGQELTEDVKRQLRIGELIYKFFNQPYQETVPTTIQLIILSLIKQSIIESKDGLDRVKAGLIHAFYKEEPKKWLMEIAVAKSLKEFDENILKNKERILALVQESHVSPNAKSQAIPQKTTSPTQVTPPPTSIAAMAQPTQPGTPAPAAVSQPQQPEASAPQAPTTVTSPAPTTTPPSDASGSGQNASNPTPVTQPTQPVKKEIRKFRVNKK